MTVLRFSKYHGLGNDFVMIDARSGRLEVTSGAARRLCDRRRGVGADGVITILPSRDARASARMHIFNADGSTAEMCGNGLRCAVHMILGGRRSGHVVIDTDAGVREGWLAEDGRVRVTLGAATLLDPTIETGSGSDRREAIGISMGNPHLVLSPFDPHQDLFALAARLGPELERHPLFPARVNVGFVAPLGPRSIRVVVFERGAGITQACGTGAGAAAVAARRWGLVEKTGSVEVELPGGPLDVAVDGDPSSVQEKGAELGRVGLIGDAHHVFDGTVEMELS